MKNQIKKAIKKYKMLSPDDKIVVGLSGGADSVALTHYLKFMLNMDVIACHVNHMLRGDESERDMMFVQNTCENWNIPLFCIKIDVLSKAKKQHFTVEEAGRQVRYTFFEQIRSSQNAQKIATAHTLSDNVETMLFSLARGTSHKGLCGIPPVRGNIIRPIIFCTRQDVEEYCSVQSLKYVTDSTNFENTYSRNKLRLEVIPQMEQINPLFEQAAGRAISALRLEEDYFKEIVQTALEKCGNSGKYDCDVFASFHPAVRHRMIAEILEEYHVERTTRLIERIDDMVMSCYGKWEISSNMEIKIRDRKLLIGVVKKAVPYFEQEIIPGKDIIFKDEIYSVMICDSDFFFSSKKVNKNLLFLVIDYDTIKGKLIFRQKKKGDTVSLFHRNGSKTLKKLFIEKKLSLYEKSVTPVIADENGVVAVWGVGVDKRCAVTDIAKHILLVTKKK